MKFTQKPIAAGLHLVSTPIGAARDITLRALDILAGADILAAEDTRTARKLMEIHGVSLNGRRIIAYHDHSGPGDRARILDPLGDGKSAAYISEAGTPLVADPGYALAREAISRGIDVLSAPGASAVLAALAVAGLPTDRFAFIGFLPPGKTQRETELAELRQLQMTSVYYESPKRVGDLLTSMSQIFGEERQATVCRELTKKFEETRRASLSELATEFADKRVRGEIVVVVGGAPETQDDDLDIETALAEAMKTMRIKDAATAVAGARGLPRRMVYQAALEMQKNQ
ncbi:MAG: 16S rRNA (cytidine(1402)-2'-O)-methyltransferase [Rhodobacteraceae bacterium]|nr:16S rRNA (cytidine(1402)-2'-O)-methyltransferase [Paracoccaceae bacterium]